MDRRRRLRVSLIVLVVVGAVVGGLLWWTSPRIVGAGDVRVVVAGHDLDPGSSYGGAGLVGTLGLVAGRCVGFPHRDGESTVAVFPAGTEVSGTGSSTAITHAGTTVRVGERISVGSADLSEASYDEVAAALPEECSRADLTLVLLGS